MFEDVEAGTVTLIENGQLVTIDLVTGDTVNKLKINNKILYMPYTVELGEAICSMIREGKTVTEISKIGGMPPKELLYRWMRRYPDFKYNVKTARLDAAHGFHDRIVEHTKTSADSQLDLSNKRLDIDTLKWLAEKNNPDQYGARTKISGDADNPIGIRVIDTGIRRTALESGSEDVIEVESEVVDEEVVDE